MQRIALLQTKTAPAVVRLPCLVVVAVLRAYRQYISPVLGPACRFSPSCSAYAMTAIERYGIVRGGGLAVRRLLRCHPWHPGGWDPVR